MSPSRRSLLGLLSATPLAAGGVLAAADAASAGPDGSGQVPRGLRPGGELDRLIAEMADAGMFSGSVLLTHRGRTVLARSHGMADRDASIPNGADTIFLLGSVTKLFTAVAIAQLAQRGAVSYGATIGTYLDGFPPEIADTVTVHHLLTHTSGMGDALRDRSYWEAAREWRSEQEVMDGTMRFVRAAGLEYAPGAGQFYSNSGYVTLGAIVAAASGGETYYEYVRRHVFEAAGMTVADFYTTPEWRDDRRIARPYAAQESGERVEAMDGHGFVGTPAGGSFANCRDLESFARALRGGDLLDPAHTELVLGPKVPEAPRPAPSAASSADDAPRYFTYGASAILAGGSWAVERGGDAPGVSVGLTVFRPDNDWVLVALGNFDSPLDVSPRTSPSREITDEATRIITDGR
ncbi:serine hydrolase domain-containing protein [Streptomyces sp. B6B3]|uniref:serine hydrolase domain-containing protein n=1 Tax=Streptomyces sp. B6B3 TaxID=3153570 RepID=UPI00325C41AE